MKLLLENFKKNMKENFRGPTDDPSFSDPGAGEPEGFDELSDMVTNILDSAASGNPATLPNGDILRIDSESGQYLLDDEVFANDYDEAENKLLRMLEPMSEEVGNLQGMAASAQKKMEMPVVTRTLDIVAKKLQNAPAQQKVEFIISMAAKIGIEPEELQSLMSRVKSTTSKTVKSASQEPSEEI